MDDCRIPWGRIVAETGGKENEKTGEVRATREGRGDKENRLVWGG